MISLEETGGACLTLSPLSGFSCFAGCRFFDGSRTDFFAFDGLGIWERREILVTKVTPIVLMIMDSDVVLLGTDLPSAILAAFVSCFLFVQNFHSCSPLEVRWRRLDTRSYMWIRTTTT